MSGSEVSNNNLDRHLVCCCITATCSVCRI